MASYTAEKELQLRRVTTGTAELCPCHESGLTLVELIITIAIISILACVALPMAKFQVK